MAEIFFIGGDSVYVNENLRVLEQWLTDDDSPVFSTTMSGGWPVLVRRAAVARIEEDPKDKVNCS